VPGDGQIATTDLVPPVIVGPALEAGTRLGDRYRLIARLGQGGGGAVWRVFDDKVGEELALKLIEGGTDLERWRREVALARRISHGNVCRVYDLGEARGLRWVTMEWIEGESLRALLQRGAVAEPERLMHQLVDAVAAIHAAGVVHRDLKPENIVVDGSGRAVIVDFGLARRPLTAELVGMVDRSPVPDVGAVTGHGTVLGTPRYMSPEQAAGEAVDARSDVYALGLVLGEIATGGSAAPTATTVGASAPEASARDTPAFALPAPWGPVIARCTARAAADRFPDAVAVRAALAAPRRMLRRLALGGALVALAAVASIALRIALADDEAPRFAPLAQRRLTSTAAAPANQPTSIAVSPDGKLLAYTVGTDLMVRAIDGGRAAAVTMPTTPGGLPLARTVEATGFLGDGRAVAQILDRDHEWALWALGAGTPPQRLYRSGERMSAALSPGGDQLAVVTPRGGLVTVALGGGGERPLIAALTGQRLAGLAWSPDGQRVGFVRHVAGGELATLETVAVAQPATTQVLARVRLPDPVDDMTAWPMDGRVVYVVNQPDGAALMAVPVGAAPAAPATIVRWPDEYVAQLAWGHGRAVVLRGSAERAIETGTVDRRGYYLNLDRAVPEHARAGQLAGWSADGRLIYAGDADVVVRSLLGSASVLAPGIPDAVFGDAVIYHRAAAIRAVAVAGGGDRALVELPAPPVGGDLVRCAGDRALPCVIADVDRAGVRYLRFDPATGARGGELHRAAIGPRFAHAMAVSPDGATLAVADGSSTVALIALAGGGAAREALARSAEIVELSWSRDGESLLVSMLAGGDDRASVVRVWPGGQRQLLLHSDQRRYERVCEAPDGNAVAIQTRELALDAWLIEGM
jgi:hypothetical protein